MCTRSRLKEVVRSETSWHQSESRPGNARFASGALLLICLTVLVLFSWPSAWGAQGGDPGALADSTRIPIGELIISGDGEVKINGVRAAWGSTVFNGSEIQTSSSMAFVNLAQCAGALSIGPSSKVKISRTTSKIIVRVFHGSVTVKSRWESQVETPDRTISSAGEDIYSILVEDNKTEAQALKNALQVKVGGALQVITPAVASSVAMITFQQGHAKPTPPRITETSERPRLLIDCRAERLYNKGLRVAGSVTIGLTPIGGAPVVTRVMFRNRLPALVITNVVTGTSGPFLGHYQAIIPAGNADLVAGGLVEVVTQVEREVASNRCFF